MRDALCALILGGLLCSAGCAARKQAPVPTVPPMPTVAEEPAPRRGGGAAADDLGDAGNEVNTELKRAENEVPVAGGVLRQARRSTIKVLRAANELIRDGGSGDDGNASAAPVATAGAGPTAATTTKTEPATSRARAASVPAGSSIAVLEFAARSGIDQEIGDSLGELVANTVRGLGEFKVLGKADLQALVGFEKVKDRLGCEETSCLAEIGGALGVDYLLGGNVSRLGGVYLINVRLVSAKQVEVAGGVSKSVQGDESALVTAVPAAVEELFGVGKGAAADDI